jgi:hypothetical protein
MIVIGTDTHKGSHALAAVDAGSGRVRGGREIKADERGHLAAVRWARGLDEERVWAIEDCRHASRRLGQALLAAGERVVAANAESPYSLVPVAWRASQASNWPAGILMVLPGPPSRTAGISPSATLRRTVAALTPIISATCATLR